MKTKARMRSEVLERFRSFVFGPANGPDEFIEGKRGLTLQYLTGILFPQGETRANLNLDGIEEKNSADADSNNEFSGDAENPLSMANESLPSSVGISFVIGDDEEFSITLGGARYQHSYKSKFPGCKKPASGDVDFCFTSDLGKGCLHCGLHGESCSCSDCIASDYRKMWVEGYFRYPLAEQICDVKPLSYVYEVFDGLCQLRVDERHSGTTKNKKIVTVSLINAQKVDSDKQSARKNEVQKRIFQTEMTVSKESSFDAYESGHRVSSDIDEKILALQFSHQKTYAVGHGVSVGWPDEVSVNKISIDYLPTEHVFRPLFDQLVAAGRKFSAQSVFELRRLADIDLKEKNIRGFYALADHYETWVEEQEGMPVGDFQQARDELVGRMKKSLSRMRRGIALLNDRVDLYEAFCHANQAMLFQMAQTAGLKELRQQRQGQGLIWPVPAAESASPQSPHLNDVTITPSWRPFQLAFFLVAFAGLEEGYEGEGEKDRNIADLIWFPTGGGKTEAYLLLASYEMLRRRRRYRESKLGLGTAVLARYTLRFLTTDQFSRISSLMVALEKVRAAHNVYGEQAFTVGMFVGDSTYNKAEDAREDISKLYSSRDVKHRIIITECPNCGTDLLPPENSDPDEDSASMGPRVSGSTLSIFCTNRLCDFSRNPGLPVRITDQDVYSRPPTFLLGTVDKFANLATKQQMVRLLGVHPGTGKVQQVPPTLIIQDELHLISGPLGTITAVYEAAIDTVIRRCFTELGFEGMSAKYVAASATVRDAEKQVQRLAARDTAIFPPQGISSMDSYFAREDTSDATARLYAGIMAQGLSSTTSAHWVLGAALQSVRREAEESGKKEDYDWLWTLLAYSNSKRELGLINAAASDEIMARMRVCEAASGGDQESVKAPRKEEISSDAVKNIAQTRSALLIPVSESGQTDVREFVPCTNMISVGVDIDRLGFMVVNGQPKSTSEYIQASSRVGRSPERQGPGLVLTLYSPAKPRDRSHYERFKSYHGALYRFVEPTSITPGTRPALVRALHAAFVIAIRYGVKGMVENADAQKFDPIKSSLREALERFEKRLLATYDHTYIYEHNTIRHEVNYFKELWYLWAKTPPSLKYAGKKSTLSEKILLPRVVEASGIGMVPMTSMRGVDVEVEVKIDG